MNAPLVPRAILRHHVSTIEAKHPLRILGLLPAGSIGHVKDQDALEFLAEKQPGLDLLGFAQAEVELGALLNRPVGLVLSSGLKDEEAAKLPRVVEPL